MADDGGKIDALRAEARRLYDEACAAIDASHGVGPGSTQERRGRAELALLLADAQLRLASLLVAEADALEGEADGG